MSHLATTVSRFDSLIATWIIQCNYTRKGGVGGGVRGGERGEGKALGSIWPGSRGSLALEQEEKGDRKERFRGAGIEGRKGRGV